MLICRSEYRLDATDAPTTQFSSSRLGSYHFCVEAVAAGVSTTSSLVLSYAAGVVLDALRRRRLARSASASRDSRSDLFGLLAMRLLHALRSILSSGDINQGSSRRRARCKLSNAFALRASASSSAAALLAFSWRTRRLYSDAKAGLSNRIAFGGITRHCARRRCNIKSSDSS